MLTYFSISEEETIRLGEKLVSQIKLGDKIFLYGDLGAGKTRFIKGIAKGLGIKKIIKSPTYVFRNEYKLSAKCKVQNAKLVHYDLYRIKKGNDLGAIGLLEDLEDSLKIVVVEWADRIAISEKRLAKSYINVFLEHRGGEKREIRIDLKNKKAPGKKETLEILDEVSTPLHVRKHNEKVAELAKKYATALIKKGEIINLELLNSACLLHDLMKHCDFKSFKGKHFEENITNEKIKKWKSHIEKYKGRAHADIGAEILRKKGYEDVARLIDMHCFNAVRSGKEFKNWEEKIIFYADKRVIHNREVTLDERFSEGLNRWYKGKEPPDFRMLKRKTEEMGEEISKI